VFHGLAAHPRRLLPALLGQMPCLRALHLEEGFAELAFPPAVAKLVGLTALLWQSSLHELPHGPYLKGERALVACSATLATGKHAAVAIVDSLL
jgi:hypothetical protein